MKRFIKQFRYGEKGFTLIELLIVVAILGVLAVVVVPNVGKFIGKGAVEAANTEVHNVQTAVMAAMVDTNTAKLSGTVGPDHTSSVNAADGTPLLIENYFTGNLEAKYTLGTDGSIENGDPLEGKWKDLIWQNDHWEEPAPAP